ncbi:MAG: dihydrofolate reductase [Lachnospiraceae bacterium]|nr:dihydrofolate reductase [Lachnospiraceae bacterium]
MNLIAAVDKNWGIGLKNQLLVRIPEDMKRFRNMTIGKVVVMGRKTLESFPGGQPLNDRTNIVLTKDNDYQVKNAVIVHDMEELFAELKKYKQEDIFVIGGESIYRQLLDQCETAYITKIDYEYQADVWFPNLDELEQWELIEESEEQTYFDLEYYFLKYQIAVQKPSET